MASSYSTSLKIQLMGNGEDSGTWGSITNSNWNLMEQAVTGVQTITMSNANYTLSNLNGVPDEARNMVLVVQGTNSAVYQVIAPLVPKTYIVSNQTVGGNAITIGGASGAVITIPPGLTTLVYCDGTGFFAGVNGLNGNQTILGNLTVTGNETVGGALGVGGAVTGASFTGAGTGLTGTANSLTAGAAANLTGVAGLGGYSVSGQDISYGSAGGPTVTGQGGGAGMMSFHRPGSYAINFGLGTDNQLRTGGWSRGGSYVILDSGNYNGYVPTLTGGNASGTWNINITGSSGAASSVAWSNVSGRPYPTTANWQYAGQGGQPSWLWGTNDGGNMYVWNPANFSVNYASSANYANSCNSANYATNATLFQGKSKLGLGITGETWNYPGRAFNTQYTNPYSYPIAVSASTTCSTGSQIYAYVNGNLVSFFQWQFNGCGSFGGAFIIVPPGASYQLNSGQGVLNWAELY